jgi:peroxiredoxin
MVDPVSVIASLDGMKVPPVALPSTLGGLLRVDQVPAGSSCLVLYFYPRVGRPEDNFDATQWSSISGAAGCTAEACSFRSCGPDLATVGAAVAGVSTEDPARQEVVARDLNLPYPLLSDADLTLATALGLPTFRFADPPCSGG